MSENPEIAESVARRMLDVLSRTGDELLGALDESLREEAWKTATSLAKRGEQIQRRINA